MSDYKQIILEHQKAPPVDLVVLGKALGVDILAHPELPDSVSGLIRKNPHDPNGFYQCYVNSAQSWARQRFTAAHELAHFCLHKSAIGDGISDDYLYRSGLSGFQEREANQLAAEILMPRHLMEAHNYKQQHPADLARLFQVSDQAMSIRITALRGQAFFR